jgi:hypothetical protein
MLLIFTKHMNDVILFNSKMLHRRAGKFESTMPFFFIRDHLYKMISLKYGRVNMQG